MPTQSRIEALRQFCQQWHEHLQSALRRRDELLGWQSKGLSIYEHDGDNLLPTLIDEADKAVQQYKKILIKMESLRDHAICGEDGYP